MQMNNESGYTTMRLPTWIPSYMPIAGAILAGIVGYVNLERDVAEARNAISQDRAEQASKWVEHAEYHKDKATENAMKFGGLEQRMSAIEQVKPAADQLTYRVTVVEQTAAATNKALVDLQSTVNSQGADIKLILELLRRQDKGAVDGLTQRTGREARP